MSESDWYAAIGFLIMWTGMSVVAGLAIGEWVAQCKRADNIDRKRYDRGRNKEHR